MPKRKYTDEQVKEAVARSTSLRQVLLTLGLVPAGGNYKCLKDTMARLAIDTSHLLGQAIHRGKKFGPRSRLEDYLANRRPIQSFKLKNRLLAEGILRWQCRSCKLTTWLGKPIPLELEHKDGNPRNNSLENLELLCPNCHTFTPTYRGKNKASRDV